MSVFVSALVAGGSIALLTCAGVFFYRRYFARNTKKGGGGDPANAAGTDRGGGLGKGGEGQAKILSDVISWVYGYPQKQIEEWANVCTRALTQQAANQKSQEAFQIRFEKIINVEAAPQLTNLTTQHNSSQKSLVVRADVYWKRFELILNVTPRRTPNAVCSIICHVIVFEFHAIVEGMLLSGPDGSILTAKFQSPPRMTMEVKQNQEVNIDIAELERLVRETISGTEVRLPLSSSGSVESKHQQQHFDNLATSSNNQLSRNVAEQKRKLLVKIIKANGLTTTQEKDYGSHQPYCIAILDSPVQKYITSSVKNTTNPFFDEQFVFDLDQTTKKLLFEVHDKDKPANDDFLGMAALTTDDFVRTRHVLPLTGRGPLTYGALTVEISLVDAAELASILSLNPIIQHISVELEPNRSQITDSGRQTTSGVSSGSSTGLQSETEISSLLTLQTPTGTDADLGSREFKSLPRSSTLPPKGDQKKKSLVGAIKQRFKRKKPDSRSQSAERSADKQSLGEGVYLTPPPSRASASIDYGGGGMSDDAENRSRSNSFRSSLSRLFHVKRKEGSPSRSSNRGINPSPEGSVGQPSPRLKSSSSNRGSPATSGRTSRVQER